MISRMGRIKEDSEGVEQEQVVLTCIDLAESNDTAAVRALLKDMMHKGKANMVARVLADERMSAFVAFDENHDGVIDVSDLLDAPVVTTDAVTRLKFAHKQLMKGQALPIFIVFQCLIVFILWLANSIMYGDASAGLDSILPGRTDLRLYSDCVDFRFQVWRWWSYQFTHVGFSHVFCNCLLALIMGIPMEGLQGPFRMFLMFNIGVFGGSCCCFLTALRMPVVGMSGGCYALFGMHYADVILNWKSKMFRWSTLAFLTILLSLDFVNYFLSKGAETSHATSNAAHVGGSIAGACIGITIGRNVSVSRHEKALVGCVFTLGFCLAAASMGIGLQWPPQSLFDDDPAWCWARQVWNPKVFQDQRWHCVFCGDAACIAKWSTESYIEPVLVNACTDQIFT